MIQRYNQKLPVCSYCLEPGHTAFQCGKKPNKTLNTYNGLKISSSFGGQRKPMNKIGKVGKQTNAAMAKFKRQQKPNHEGYYECHYCHQWIVYIRPEHTDSRTRSPKDRTNLKKMVIACDSCNEAKGSKSHDEFAHVCNEVQMPPA